MMIKNKMRDENGRFVRGHPVPEIFKEKIRNAEWDSHLKIVEIKGILNECQICGSQKRLQIHHVDGNKKNNNLFNLGIVCSYCHYSIHNIGFKTRFTNDRGAKSRWLKHKA